MLKCKALHPESLDPSDEAFLAFVWEDEARLTPTLCLINSSNPSLFASNSQSQPQHLIRKLPDEFYNPADIPTDVPHIVETAYFQSNQYDIFVTDEVDPELQEGGHMTRMTELNDAARGTDIGSPQRNAMVDYRNYLRGIAKGMPTKRGGFALNSETLLEINRGMDEIRRNWRRKHPDDTRLV